MAFVALALGGCASDPPRGVVHVVRPGETVWRIAYRYGVSTEAVVRANHIEDVTRVRVGQRLWIPGATRPMREAPPPPRTLSSDHAACLAGAPPFAWPVRGTLTSSFGRRGRRRHDGIDLSARRGTPIRAAAPGRVIHSGGELGDYGKVVIIKHAGHWISVYAHNRRNLVQEGAFVERGDVIAEVGKTGNATGPHLHFEIRYAGTPRDPIACLP